MKSVSIVIPAYNEEEGIGSVLSLIPTQRLNDAGYSVEVIVVDNASTDKTAEIAHSHGVRVVYQPLRGYGNAYKAGFSSATGDIIATGDADSTYPLDHLPELLQKMEGSNIEFLNTNRLQTLRKESMSRWHVFGNWVLTTIMNVLYGITPFKDSQSGMWIFNRYVWDAIEVESDGMPFSQELKLEAYWKGFACGEVPIEYRPRLGEVKLRGMQDAWLNMSEMFTKRLRIQKVKKNKIQRIAFVLDTVAPYSKGGRETRLQEISKRLVRPDREVHIYTMQWWDGPKDMVQGGVHYHALCKLYPIYKNDRRSIAQALLFSASVFKLLSKDFDILDVDHMPFFPLFSARIVTWLKGKKLYATWHEVWGQEYWQEYLGGFAGIFGGVIERLSFWMPDVIISNSAHTTAKLRAAGYKREIKTVPLGVDLEGIYSASQSKNTSDIIYVGRLLSHKGVDMLVRAVALVKESMPDIRALVVGSGPEAVSLQALIGKLGLQNNISVIDGVDTDADLYGLMKASKMLVLPSIREGFGLVVVEAQAAGIPVITVSHKDNAAQDLIKEGVNGLLAQPTAKDIAEKIKRVLLGSEVMRPSFEVEKYHWDKTAQNLEEAFG